MAASGQSRSILSPVANVGYREPPTLGSAKLTDRPQSEAAIGGDNLFGCPVAPRSN